MKREYDEFKVWINGLLDSICRHSDAYHAWEELQAMKLWLQQQLADNTATVPDPVKIPKATWMATTREEVRLRPQQEGGHHEHTG